MLPDRWLRLVTAGNRGLALLFTGDVAGARGAFREELALVGELVVVPVAQEALLGLAAVAAEEGDLRRAATLAGSAGARDQEPQTVDVVARIEERFLRPARDALGDAGWEAGVREGARLGFEAAVAYGLEEPMPAGAQSER
jgi:non-specific serine/threonine protein kinase